MITSTVKSHEIERLRSMARNAAAIAVERALDDANEPEAVLDIAQHFYQQIMGKHSMWPNPEILH